MTLEAKLFGFLAETPAHVGIGQMADTVDLPVAREATTQFPHIPGSGVKGAFRVWYNEAIGYRETTKTDLDGNERVVRIEKNETRKLFGMPGDDADLGAGAVLFGETRLALLPVRSTNGAVRWVSCPLILSRLRRDAKRTNARKIPTGDVPQVEQGSYLGNDPSVGLLGLEQREFRNRTKSEKSKLSEWLTFLMGLAPDLQQCDFLQRIVILNDHDFTWFAKCALPVVMRNRLTEDKIVAPGALWSEETLPSDSVMWMVAGERKQGALKTLSADLSGNRYIQIGGNETIGQGWFSLTEVP